MSYHPSTLLPEGTQPAQGRPRKKSLIRYVLTALTIASSTTATICGALGITAFESTSIFGPISKIGLRGSVDMPTAPKSEDKNLITNTEAGSAVSSATQATPTKRTTQTNQQESISNNPPTSYISLPPISSKDKPNGIDGTPAGTISAPKIDNSEFSFGESTLVASTIGDKIQFRYKQVRRSLFEQGVRAGDLFLEVSLSELGSGMARLRSARCGILPYEVIGQFNSDFTSGVFKGTTRRFDSSCSLAGDPVEMTIRIDLLH